jgi:hypothetical protein
VEPGHHGQPAFKRGRLGWNTINQDTFLIENGETSKNKCWYDRFSH